MDLDSDIMDDAGVWASLAALVNADAKAKEGKGPDHLTQAALQEAVGLSIMTTRRARLLLEKWGLATSEERLDGRTRSRVSRVTDHGRRVHKMREELRAALQQGKATTERRAKGRE